MFPLFFKMTSDILSRRLKCGISATSSFLLFPNLLETGFMAPIFQKVHLPLQLLITDRFPQHLYCEGIERSVSVRLGRFMESRGVLPTTNSLIGKVSPLVITFCVCINIRRPRLCRSTSTSLSYFIFAVPMRECLVKTLVHEFIISYSHTE